MNPSTSDLCVKEPARLQGRGRQWPIFAALQETALRRYGHRDVDVEDVSGHTLTISLDSLLDYLPDQFSPRRYLRHQLLSELDPALWALVPSEVRRLNWLTALPRDVRPNWAWLMVGTMATRSPMHVDVDASAAWNLLCVGKKRWTFHSPTRAKQWGLLPPGSPGGDGAMVTFVQEPGDLVITPSGWAHEVENLTGTISVTANFINEHNLPFAEQYFRCLGDDASCALLAQVEAAFIGQRALS